MSLATLERAILKGAQSAFNNPKLRQKDILVWSTAEMEPEAGEVVLRIPDPGAYVCIKAEKDKRKK
jgi:hypothetical protein